MRKLIAAVSLSLIAAMLGIPLAAPSGAAINVNTLPVDSGAVGWGYGQRVTGMNEGTPAPMPIARGDIPASATITSVKGSGQSTVCAVADGLAYCWGYGSGTLGRVDPDGLSSPIPVAVDTSGPLDGKTIIDAVGGNTSCALASDSTIACWGYGDRGSLGNGTTSNSPVPVAVDRTGIMAGKTITELAGGGNSICALAATYEVYCWGAGTSGSLGDGLSSDSSLPVAADLTAVGADHFVHIYGASTGNYGTFCGLTNVGSVFCWGENSNGTAGVGNTNIVTAPTAVTTNSALPQNDAASVSMAGDHTCVLRTTGAAACFGFNNYGQLGDRTQIDSSVPVAVDPSDDPDFGTGSISAIAAVQYATCAILDSRTYCWGTSYYGRLGDNGQSGDVFTDAVEVSDNPIGLNGEVLTSLHAVASGTVCGTTAASVVFCWGQNSSGEAGNGSANQIPQPAPVFNGSLAAGQYWTRTAMGFAFACATSNVGEVWCWGENNYGEVGVPTSTRNVPVARKVQGSLAGKTITQISAAGNHVCALDSAGAMYCWGEGDAGQLGDGTTSHSDTPVSPDFTAMPAGRHITQIATGYATSCAVDNLGSAYCWGDNSDGQLGLGDRTSRDVPTLVSTGDLVGKVVRKIASMYSDTCAIDSNGIAYCWGYNSNGAAGNSAASRNQTEPIAVDTTNLPAGAKFTQISTGEDYSCGVAGGKAYCWGKNNNGQLGTGDTGSYDIPTAVDTSGVLAGKTMSEVIGGYDNTCALDTDGEVYCWGWNGNGQLADRTQTRSLVPMRPLFGGTLEEGITGFASLATGGDNAAWQAVISRGGSATAPTAPRTPRARASKAGTSAVLTWSAPSSDGGSAVTRYTVQARPQGKTKWTAVRSCASVGTALTCTATQLNKTLRYTFRVKASNDVGSSAFVAFNLARKASIAITVKRTTDGKGVVNGKTIGLFGKVIRVRVRAAGGKVKAYATTKITPTGTFSVKIATPKGKFSVGARYKKVKAARVVIRG